MHAESPPPPRTTSEGVGGRDIEALDRCITQIMSVREESKRHTVMRINNNKECVREGSKRHSVMSISPNYSR